MARRGEGGERLRDRKGDKFAELRFVVAHRRAALIRHVMTTNAGRSHGEQTTAASKRQAGWDHDTRDPQTVATELANSDVSVYTLMTLLGHESMVTSQRYVTAAGTETRSAVAQNKL